MHGVSAPRRFSSAAVRLARRFIDDFQTTSVLLLLRISLPLLKRTVGVKRLTGWLRASSAETASSETSAKRIQRARETMAHGGRLLIGRNCLDRSLAGLWLLRRAGEAPTLVLGAKREHGKLEGHAWLELGNVPLETRADEFVRVASFGGD
jgi:Transglutaminase-like superfamily